MAENTSALIEEYIRLRDAKSAAADKIKKFIQENYTARMDIIEGLLMQQLDEVNADSLKTEHGTAFKKVETSVTVADGAAFSRYVIGEEKWELIDFRANKTAVKDFVEANDGNLPPGLNFTQELIINVRRPA